MKTINKILHLHNTNLLELENLEINGYINGCGGKGHNLDNYIKEGILLMNNFDEDKSIKLFKDLRIICQIHDMCFWKKIGFYKSNYFMARDIFLITNWTGFFQRLGLSIGVFILLNHYGKKYYK